MKKLLYLFLLLVVSTTSAQEFESAVSAYLNANHSQMGLQLQDVGDITVQSQSFSKSMQLNTVYVNQNYQGIEIFNSVSSFAIRGNQVLNANVGFVSNLTNKVNATSPSISASTAINKAATALGLPNPSNLQLLESDDNSYVYSNGAISLENIPVKLVYQPTQNNTLNLSWDLSIYLLDASHYYSVRIDAVTGALLDKMDWVSSCNFDTASHVHNVNPNSILFDAEPTNVNSGGSNQYRVFAIPLRNPDGGSDTLEDDPADATASPFGWHDTDGASGAEHTITRGNNAWAQEDQNNNNGTGYSPDGGASLVFDFPFGLPQPPQDFLDASITNLYYWNNVIHDVTYQYGFDETSGNFQENNYGNGGAGSDSVNADAQDGGGTNNANFATPPDGNNPRMQMYIWTSSSGEIPGLLTINNGPLAGDYAGYPAGFGGSFPATPLTEDLVVVEDDDAGTSTDPNDACDNITNGGALNGKIAVIRRGECEFGFKSLAAETAGAVAVIIVNNVAGATILMGGGAVGASVTIPVFMINNVDGEAIIAEALGNTVNGTINGALVPPNIDGDLDNEIVVHEYAHGVSNRLTGGPNNTSCLQNEEQMGEGWSDYLGLIMTMYPGDVGADVRGLASYASGNPNGIRTYAYSTDFGINPHTYDDIKTEVAPHGVGSVWAAMLWELTWELIDDYGFDADIYGGSGGNNIAFQLVMDGMKLQPCAPGFVTGRDAILEADMLANGGANQCAIWDAFARRGLGVSASQGSSNSKFDGTEAFDVPGTPGCILGTSDNSFDNNFKIYPNPSNGQINISTIIGVGEVTITLTDLNGRKVFTQVTELNDLVTLNATNLSAGIYVVQIEGGAYVHTAKLIIK